MLPTIFVGDRFEQWLDSQWSVLFGYESPNAVIVIEKINAFLDCLRRDPSGISSSMKCVKDSGQPSLANYLCSQQYVDAANYRRGPWSFMSEQEWQVVKRVTADECTTRDAEAMLVDFTWCIK